jgi:hypothetical protein
MTVKNKIQIFFKILSQDFQKMMDQKPRHFLNQNFSFVLSSIFHLSIFLLVSLLPEISWSQLQLSVPKAMPASTKTGKIYENSYDGLYETSPKSLSASSASSSSSSVLSSPFLSPSSQSQLSSSSSSFQNLKTNHGDIFKIRCESRYRLGLNGQLFLSPSSERGLNDVGDFSSQFLLACQKSEKWELKSEIQLRPLGVGSFQGFSSFGGVSSSSESKFPLELQQLNINRLGSMFDFSAGLFWDPWIHQGNLSTFGTHLIQSDFESLASRASLLPRYESGVQISKKLQGIPSLLGIRLSSGEFWPNAEKGPSKDFTVWIRSASQEENFFSWLFYGRWGRYDFVDPVSSEKRRLGLQLKWDQKEGLKGALHLLHHLSGADGLNGQHYGSSLRPVYGEGLDLVTLGGQSLQGLFVDTWLAYQFVDSFSEIFLRWGQAGLHQGSGHKGHSFITSQLGYQFRLDSEFKVTFFGSKTDYVGTFLLGVQNRHSLGMNFEFLF